MKEKAFPQVSDDEIMLTDMPQMNLYEEGDFISNIQGDYVDKNYLDWESIVDNSPASVREKSREVARITRRRPSGSRRPNVADVVKSVSKSYAELAREEARADLKRKRSAAYLTSDIVSKARPHKPGFSLGRSSSKAPAPKPTAPFQKENAGEFAKYGDKLKQDTYILADVKPDLTPKPAETRPKNAKNNYDFLKKSQIYNKKEMQSSRERSIAQELNLTRLDEK